MLRRLLGKGGQDAELGPIQAMRLFYEDGRCRFCEERTYETNVSCVGDGYPSTGLKVFDVALVYILGGFFGSFLGFGKLPDTEDDKTK
jgi:hypothetical protein